MKDFQGVELQVGDWVATTIAKYRDLVRGRIVKFTKVYVHIQHDVPLWNHSPIIMSNPEYVIKLIKQDNDPSTNPA